MTTIVTGFSASGYREYGKRMIESYIPNSPFPLIVYTQDVQPLDGVEQFDQMDIPGLKDFLTRWDGNSLVSGCEPNGSWKPREIQTRYSYKYDIFKFSKMIYTMWAAAHILHERGETKMIWFDGDTLIRRRLPDDLFERSTPSWAAYGYLGREPKHSETGFVTWRIPESLPILDKWVSYCNEDTFLNFKEYHSAYLFDRARECFPEIKGNNLTPGGNGHVIHQCFVGDYMTHLKGNRKSMGYSPEERGKNKIR